ncbi:hypothetical protein STCU_10751 [Strigomonas culicis]|uniref:Uncharacterized protein n=1 Tax=Strigomonas culicis TaxID=28005 RepID=S9URK1_9TRYP|nr:hypothetical protein STCU_10751 [Strigomonas culicis]|eukprot:EPY17216.1 hypothetical protein STCU_10751 [Strigomonas culicis]
MSPAGGRRRARRGEGRGGGGATPNSYLYSGSFANYIFGLSPKAQRSCSFSSRRPSAQTPERTASESASGSAAATPTAGSAHHPVRASGGAGVDGPPPGSTPTADSGSHHMSTVCSYRDTTIPSLRPPTPTAERGSEAAVATPSGVTYHLPVFFQGTPVTAAIATGGALPPPPPPLPTAGDGAAKHDTAFYHYASSSEAGRRVNTAKRQPNHLVALSAYNDFLQDQEFNKQ